MFDLTGTCALSRNSGNLESTLQLLILFPTWQPERICSVLLPRDKLGSMGGRLMKVDFGSREHFQKIRQPNDECAAAEVVCAL